MESDSVEAEHHDVRWTDLADGGGGQPRRALGLEARRLVVERLVVADDGSVALTKQREERTVIVVDADDTHRLGTSFHGHGAHHRRLPFP